MIDTAVIGAGIGGLATAALLARTSFGVTVYEARSTVEPRGADVGISLHPNGLAVLDALGLVPELSQSGSRLSRLRLFDERMHLLADVEPPGGDRTGSGPVLVVSSHRLHRLLWEAAKDAGASIRVGSRLTAIGSDPTAPRIYFQDGQSESFLVVGADGMESVVRRMVGTGDEGHRVRERRYVRAMVDWPLNENAAGQYWTRGGVSGLLPCGPGRTYWYATVTLRMQNALDEGDIERFRRTAASAHPPALQVVGNLKSLDDLLVSHVRHVNLDRFYRGSYVLIGDAAHSMDPNLGQGANAALVDAAVLASELHRRDHLAEALAAYDSRRVEAVHQVQADAARLARLAHFTVARRLRNTLAKSAPERIVQGVRQRSQQVDLVALRHELAELAPK